MEKDSGERRLNVLITAPFPAVREGLSALVETDPGIRVIGKCASPAEWDSHTSSTDLILLAPITMNLTDWSRILSLGERSIPILCLLSHPLQSLPAFGARPWGVLPFSASGSEITHAIHALMDGVWVMDPDLFSGERSDEYQNEFETSEALPETLTNREIDVLQCLALGDSNKEIASKLQISPQTVKFHISSIYSKLNVNNRIEAVRIGVHLGWVNL